MTFISPGMEYKWKIGQFLGSLMLVHEVICVDITFYRVSARAEKGVGMGFYLLSTIHISLCNNSHSLTDYEN